MQHFMMLIVKHEPVEVTNIYNSKIKSSPKRLVG